MPLLSAKNSGVKPPGCRAIHRGAMREQQLQVIDAAGGGGVHQRALACRVHGIHRRARLEHVREDRCRCMPGAQGQRRDAIRARATHIGVRVEQQRQHLRVAVFTAQQQRQCRDVAGRIRLRAGGEQQLHHTRILRLDGPGQWSRTIRQVGVRGSAAGEARDTGVIAGANRIQQRTRIHRSRNSRHQHRHHRAHIYVWPAHASAPELDQRRGTVAELILLDTQPLHHRQHQVRHGRQLRHHDMAIRRQPRHPRR